MSDMHSKRKYAGEPHKDQRAAKAPDVERLPPHKKPKVWRLTIQFTELTTRQLTHKYTSKAARDEARVRIERHFREQEQRKTDKRHRYYHWAGYYNSPLYHFEEAERHEVKAGPTYIETYEDA